MSAPWGDRRLHFVGVGGAGMSGYARAAHALGAQVSGSDRSDSPYLKRLCADGVLVSASIGHATANVPEGADVELVYSSAIDPENPERAAARERGLPEHPRADLLAELSALRHTIAVAGTHGKTTTSSMLVHALRGANLDPGWLVGAEVGGGLPNAHWSEGEWLVVEADESDRSMLSLRTEIAVVTNVELDHHATYRSLGELREVFRAFLAAAPQAVIWDRPEVLQLRGAGSVVPYDAPDPDLHAGIVTFDWHGHEVTLAVPGAHNAQNAAGALEATQLTGADMPQSISGLAGFTGARRRFAQLGSGPHGAAIYEDYAHHPTEIEATLGAARTLQPQRLVAVFQPHLYTRTEQLARELGRALALADVVAVTDVYAARERQDEHPGVSGLLVAEAAADAMHGRPVYWLPTLDGALPVLCHLLRAGDLCMVMGAGDIDTLAHGLVAEP
jgi:UDP-N-acetylmuramate--alanine ligase